MNNRENTICFYARKGQCKLYSKIGNNLESKGVNVCYIVQNEEEKKIVESFGCKGEIFCIDTYLHINWDNNSLLNGINLSEIETKYEIDSLWSIYYTDRFLTKYNYEDSIKFIKLHILFFLSVIEKLKPNYLFNEEIAIFSSYIFYILGKKNNCKYVGFSNPRLIGDKNVALVKDATSNYFHLDTIYQNNRFDKEQLNKAKKFIENFREKATIPPYMKTGSYSKLKPTINISFLYSIIKYFILLISNKKNDRINYMEYKAYNLKLNSIKFYLNYLKQRRYYRKPNKLDKYFLFPLHYQPEASTLVNAQNYEKQQFAVDLIAKKIPVKYKLYVKEHYSVLGHREMEFYKNLKKYPNVVLINPYEDSHSLIKNSQGVITLTGTAGWESILYGKPTFILGNVFYSSFKYAWKISNIDDLSKIINKSIKYPYNNISYYDELLKYVAAYLNSVHPGYYYLIDKKRIVSLKNISNIQNIIEKILNKEININ